MSYGGVAIGGPVHGQLLVDSHVYKAVNVFPRIAVALWKRGKPCKCDPVGRYETHWYRWMANEYGSWWVHL